MSTTPAPVPARNSLCTCGSGKKYKNCCGAGREIVPVVSAVPGGPPKSSAKLVIGITLALLAAAISVMVLVTNRRQVAPAQIVTTAPASPGATAGLPGGPTPAPWYYDANLNRHWDPTPGHNHWHNGPPPVVAGLPMNAAAAGATPAPWFHDIVNNRHWDPTPGHNHWHDGPPPAPADRK